MPELLLEGILLTVVTLCAQIILFSPFKAQYTQDVHSEKVLSLLLQEVAVMLVFVLSSSFIFQQGTESPQGAVLHPTKTFDVPADKEMTLWRSIK